MQHDYSGHEEKIAPDQLILLNTLADNLDKAELEAEALEEQLKAVQEKARAIRENDLPELMQAIGLKEITTANGLNVQLKEEIRASFFAKDPTKREPAFSWLKDNNHDGLIKNMVSVTFPKGQEAVADEVVRMLKEREGSPLNVERKRDINHQTMLAFLRERLREGEEVPLPLFGAFIQKFAKVSRK